MLDDDDQMLQVAIQASLASSRQSMKRKMSSGVEVAPSRHVESVNPKRIFSFWETTEPDADLEYAIQLSRIGSSLEPCDLCGLVLKACELGNKPLPYNQYMSEEERARAFLYGLAPEVLDRVITDYEDEQERLRAGSSYCSNAKCLRLLSAGSGIELQSKYQLIGARVRKVCCFECDRLATLECIEVACELNQLDNRVN